MPPDQGFLTNVNCLLAEDCRLRKSDQTSCSEVRELTRRWSPRVNGPRPLDEPASGLHERMEHAAYVEHEPDRSRLRAEALASVSVPKFLFC